MYSGASPFTPLTGFVSNRKPHAEIYGVPDNLPTLHSQSDHYHFFDYFTDQHYNICCLALAVDDNDFVVPAQRTIELQKLFSASP